MFQRLDGILEQDARHHHQVPRDDLGVGLVERQQITAHLGIEIRRRDVLG